jgi:uncharacterized membrane protein YkvA (DUF1232 family)
MSLKTRIFLLLGAIYAISPIDIIPDTIPILGQMDDLIVLRQTILVACGSEYTEFKQWRATLEPEKVKLLKDTRKRWIYI